MILRVTNLLNYAPFREVTPNFCTGVSNIFKICARILSSLLFTQCQLFAFWICLPLAALFRGCHLFHQSSVGHSTMRFETIICTLFMNGERQTQRHTLVQMECLFKTTNGLQARAHARVCLKKNDAMSQIGFGCSYTLPFHSQLFTLHICVFVS